MDHGHALGWSGSYEYFLIVGIQMVTREVTRIHNFEVRGVRITLNEIIIIVAHDRSLTMLPLRLKVHLVIALNPYLRCSSLLIKLSLL